MSEYVGEYVVSLTPKTFTDLRFHRHEEIVRCRDCEYYHDGTNNGRRYAEPHCLAIGELAYGALFDVDENDFCSWAKRKVDAQPQRLRGEGE